MGLWSEAAEAAQAQALCSLWAPDGIGTEQEEDPKVKVSIVLRGLKS